MQLGNGTIFRYILRSTVQPAVGSIETGTVERDALSGVTVRDDHGAVIQSLSGTLIRSWNILGPDGTSIDSDIVPQDLERLR
jgi:hypothetical protein